MSELVQVKIKGTVVTSRYGTLSSGDILRTDAEFAKHLVDDCGAADYVGTAAAQAKVDAIAALQAEIAQLKTDFDAATKKADKEAITAAALAKQTELDALTAK